MTDFEFRFTVELLQEYCTAALQNATELLSEASLLFSNGHAARAYFLAVASIEETGKAMQSFDALGRNLGDSAVTTKLRRAMEDHSQKITAAFTPALLASPNLRDAMKTVVELMIHLKRGREPSMYTDISYEESKVRVPTTIVRDIAAQDCIRLAHDCLTLARKHIAEKKPETRSRTDDELFALKTGQLRNVMNTEDFWWFYIAQLEAGKQDFAAAAVAYRRDFASKGKTFKRPAEKNGGA